MKPTDLNLLPIAFALYDELNVSRAARALGMSQPAVSMALRRLREAFNDPLFVRVPTGIVPTPRAHTLVRAARPLLDELQHSLRAKETFDPARTASTFTIALTDVGELAFLLRLFKAFRAQAPMCVIRSVVVPPAQLAHELEQGEIDLAVGYYPTLSSKNFRQRRVETQRFACLMRTEHPRRAPRLLVKEFAALEHIAVRAEGRSQELIERFFERRRVRRNIVLVTPHFLSIPFVVGGSDLVATIPERLAGYFASQSAALSVVALPFADEVLLELKLHWHRRFDNEPRSRWLREQFIHSYGVDA
ncbi:MAG TPA: LysR family transcriptional regulator [Vicinamibacterales bacterium]|nr:LysR family transcriptional regulator [Vicinamibacterales bacterium]